MANGVIKKDAKYIEVKTTDSTYLQNSANISRSGKVVTITILGLKNIPQGQSVILFNLPSDCVPTVSAENNFVSNVYSYEARLEANKDGRLYCYAFNNTSVDHLRGTFTYVI